MTEAPIAERLYTAAEYVEKMLRALRRADRIARGRKTRTGRKS